MPKWSSFFTRFFLALCLCILGITVIFYGMSSYYFSDIYLASHYDALQESLRQGSRLLARYRAGEITQEALRAATNPVLTTDDGFFMLLDREKNVLAYTESAAPYFAGKTLPALMQALEQEAPAIARSRDTGTTALLIGERTEDGYVFCGRPMRLFVGAAFSFRNRLFFSMFFVVCMALAASIVAARRAMRPARMITEMAARLTEGEQVLLPDNLPGKEMREIAGALNYMSRTVAHAIQELRYEKETMALILEGLNEGILAVDEKGAILHENAAAWRLVGGEETDAYHAVMDALREKRPEDQWEKKFTAGDRILFFAVSRLPAEAGNAPRGTVALIRDITEQEHLERTRHDYVANISHELRTPLSSIRGLGEGLRDGLVTEEKDRLRYYNIIVEEVTRLSRLVNDLLELSSLQSNPAAFEMEKVDPNELIYDLHDRNERLFAQKDIAFDRALPREPLPFIVSNEDRLAQVLTIFLDNARKFTPAGGSVVLGAEAAPGGIRFFVKDTGIGMDQETQRLAFERFHQAESSHSEKGSGLGLSIAREILLKMGVEITLNSAPGAGSEFSFVIPEKENSRAAASV